MTCIATSRARRASLTAARALPCHHCQEAQEFRTDRVCRLQRAAYTWFRSV